MIKAEALRGFVREITVASQKTPQLMHDAMVRQAIVQRDRVLREQSARSGFAPTYRQIVGGLEGGSLDAWKPGDSIVFIWNYIAEVIIEAWTATAAAVPVRTGNLLEHLTMFVDGVEAGRGSGGGEVEMSLITAATKRIVIVADTPYARRLEVGLDASGGPFVVQVRPHFIEQTAIILQARFRDQARISFNFTMLGDNKGGLSARGNFGQRRRRGVKGPMRYPSITIEPRTA